MESPETPLDIERWAAQAARTAPTNSALDFDALGIVELSPHVQLHPPRISCQSARGRTYSTPDIQLESPTPRSYIPSGTTHKLATKVII